MAQIDGVKNWLNMALPLKIVINRTNEIAYFVEIDIPCMENADLILTVHITSIYKMCPPPPNGLLMLQPKLIIVQSPSFAWILSWGLLLGTPGRFLKFDHLS